MQQEINLLSKLPRGKRNVNARAEAKTDEIIAISRQYGELYFDGPRKYGYGGYRYDGRWIPVAEDMVKHFDLKPGDRVLDVGCGKGFLVKDLIKVCPGLEAFGLDISEYALMHCEPEVVGRLHLGNAVKLPFPDKSFKAVISLNTVHNLDRPILHDGKLSDRVKPASNIAYDTSDGRTAFKIRGRNIHLPCKRFIGARHEIASRI
jgi:SAM-dependent methyltransferase